MAKKKSEEQGVGTMNCDPLQVFQDMRDLVLEKYPNIKIAEIELALAWYIMDLDMTVCAIAPESQTVDMYNTIDKMLLTVDMYNTIDKMLFATDGARNTIFRILSNIELLNNEIEKAKKKQHKDHEHKG